MTNLKISADMRNCINYLAWVNLGTNTSHKHLDSKKWIKLSRFWKTFLEYREKVEMVSD